MSGPLPHSFRAKDGKKTLIWLSNELRARLDAVANANFRNLTAEVNQRLEESFENQSIGEHGEIVYTRPALKSDNHPGGHS